MKRFAIFALLLSLGFVVGCKKEAPKSDAPPPDKAADGAADPAPEKK